MSVLLAILFLQAQQFFTVEEYNFDIPEENLISTAWTIEDGLPVNSVNEIIQDSTGYIWISTYDGIVRFDGLNFEVYTHANTPGMPQNRAVYLTPQSGDKLWITLENGGVILKDGEKFSHFDENDGFTNSNVTDIVINRDGDAWFASLDGVHRYRNGEFETIYQKKTNLQNQVNTLYEDVDGSFWFATAAGLIHYDEGKILHYKLPESKDQFIQNVKRTPSGELLLSGRGGVYGYLNGEITALEKFDTLNETRVYLFVELTDNKFYIASTNGLYEYVDNSISLVEGHQNRQSPFLFHLEDSRGRIWLINDDGEIYQLVDNQLTPFNLPEAGDPYYVKMIMEDAEGNLWITTARDGLIRLKFSQSRNITTENGLSGNNILGLYEDRNGNHWVGTRDEGLNKITGNTVTQYYEETPPMRNVVHSINQDPDGNMWVGYYNDGLVKFDKDGSNYTAYSIGPTEQLNDVRSIYFKSDSSMWIGTYGGLVHFDPVDENHTYYTSADGPANDLVRYIDEDEHGVLWLATVQNGVGRFKDGEFQYYTVEDGLASNNIRSVYVDEFDNGTIWVGTETNGISRVKDNQIRSLTTQDGLPDHVIHYIAQDSLGFLWLSSNKGIIKLQKEALNDYLDGRSDSFDMIHFDKSDGMLNPEANGSFQQGGILTSSGHFWFATQEGVAIFPVQSKQRNTVPPKMVLNRIESGGINFNLSENSPVELNRGEDNFTINFHSLTFTSPEKTRFRYRLKGYNDHWTEVYNVRTASFSDIPAGMYTFQLLSANNHGVWNSEPAEANIIVTDFFYNQWWFFPTLFLLIFLGYIPVSRLRYRYLMHKQEKMEAIIEKQTTQLQEEKKELEKRNEIIKEQSQQLQELNDTKDKFFSIIAHDLRNPFQAILGFTEIMIEDAEQKDDQELLANLEQIDIAGKRVFDLLQNLLKWASLQTGRIESNTEICWLDTIIKHSIELLEYQATQKGISITADIPPDKYVYADQNMLRTILQNLITNAIKFSKEDSEIRILVKEDPKNMSISVCDQGIGIPEDMLEKLMKLDTNTSRTGTNQEKGSGLGLIITKEMISMQNGSIEIESAEGEGTSITISFPKKRIYSSKSM